jgi:hypothetical protein
MSTCRQPRCIGGGEPNNILSARFVPFVKRTIAGCNELAKRVRRNRNLAMASLGFDKNKLAPDFNGGRVFGEITSLSVHSDPLSLNTSERKEVGRRSLSGRLTGIIARAFKRYAIFIAGIVCGAIGEPFARLMLAILTATWNYLTHPTPLRFALIACEIALVWMIRRHWQARAA